MISTWPVEPLLFCPGVLCLNSVLTAQTAFAELVGCAASCGYLALVMRAVDAVTPDTRVPLAAAERVTQQPARLLALTFAAYQCAAFV